MMFAGATESVKLHAHNKTEPIVSLLVVASVLGEASLPDSSSQPEQLSVTFNKHNQSVKL